MASYPVILNPASHMRNVPERVQGYDWDMCDGEMTEKRLSNLAVAGHRATDSMSTANELADESGGCHAFRALNSLAISAGSTCAPAGSPLHESQSGLGGTTTLRSMHIAAAADAVGCAAGRSAPVQAGVPQGAIDRATFVSDDLYSAAAPASAPGTPAGIKSLESDVLRMLEGEESAASAPTPVSLGDQRGVTRESPGVVTMDAALASGAAASSRRSAPRPDSSGLEVQITNIACASTQSSPAGSVLPPAAAPSPQRNCKQLQLQLGTVLTQPDAIQSPLANAFSSMESASKREHETAVVSPAAVVVPGGERVSGCNSAESGGAYGESENLDDYSGAGSTTQYNSVRAASIREGAAIGDSDKGSACARISTSGGSQCDVAVATGAAELHDKEDGQLGVGKAAESPLQSLEGSAQQPADDAASHMCGSVEGATGMDVALQGATTAGESEGPNAIFDSCGSETPSVCMHLGGSAGPDASEVSGAAAFGIGGLSLQIIDVSENPISTKMCTPEEIGAVGGSPRLSPRRLSHGNACLLYTSPSPRDRQKSRMPSSA